VASSSAEWPSQSPYTASFARAFNASKMIGLLNDVNYSVHIGDFGPE
jgi:hypothetical protein